MADKDAWNPQSWAKNAEEQGEGMGENPEGLDPEKLDPEEIPPAINIPAIILILISVFFIIHGIRRYILTPETDFWLIIWGSFIPVRFTGVSLAEFPGGHFAQIYSWLTYNFLHGDFQHIFFNSIWFVIFGSAVARRISSVSFAVFFVMTSCAGALVYLMMHWGSQTPVIGASAVVSGLMGGATRFMFGEIDKDKPVSENWISDTRLMTVLETFKNKNALFLIVTWMILNYLMGVGIITFGESGNAIAWEAHVGGFVAGLLFYGFFEKPVSASLNLDTDQDMDQDDEKTSETLH